MPTGYTDIITKGATLEQYVWRCTRAFGATIMQRDDRLGERVRVKQDPSDYHVNALREAQSKLAELRAMTPEKAEPIAAAEYESAHKYWKRREHERAEENAAYNAMREKVLALKLPESHASFREFMLDQISVSTFDYKSEPPKRRTGAEWLADGIADAERDIVYHTKGHAEELERCRERTEWLATIAAIVPQPERMEPNGGA